MTKYVSYDSIISNRAFSELLNQNFSELLVVVAIIAILAALLMPALQKAREMTRKITCANNQKQLTLVIYNYCSDFDGILPTSMKNNTEISNDWWQGFVGKYNCPRQFLYSDAFWKPNFVGGDRRLNLNSAVCLTTYLQRKASGDPEYYHSYKINSWLGIFVYTSFSVQMNGTIDYKGSTYMAHTHTMRPFYYPSTNFQNYILLLESYKWENPLGTYPSQGNGGTPDQTRMLNVHLGTRNMSFLDGHVESLPISNIHYFAGKKIINSPTNLITKHWVFCWNNHIDYTP